jgi:hypothetical protein
MKDKPEPGTATQAAVPVFCLIGLIEANRANGPYGGCPQMLTFNPA